MYWPGRTRTCGRGKPERQPHPGRGVVQPPANERSRAPLEQPARRSRVAGPCRRGLSPIELRAGSWKCAWFDEAFDGGVEHAAACVGQHTTGDEELAAHPPVSDVLAEAQPGAGSAG